MTVREKRKMDSNSKRTCQERLESVLRVFSSFYLYFYFSCFPRPRRKWAEAIYKGLRPNTQHNERKADWPVQTGWFGWGHAQVCSSAKMPVTFLDKTGWWPRLWQNALPVTYSCKQLVNTLFSRCSSSFLAPILLSIPGVCIPTRASFKTDFAWHSYVSSQLKAGMYWGRVRGPVPPAVTGDDALTLQEGVRVLRLEKVCGTHPWGRCSFPSSAAGLGGSTDVSCTEEQKMLFLVGRRAEARVRKQSRGFSQP